MFDFVVDEMKTIVRNGALYSVKKGEKIYSKHSTSGHVEFSHVGDDFTSLQEVRKFCHKNRN